MRIAVATQDFARVSGHAGKACEWLVYDCQPGAPLPAPQRVSLEKSQLFHYFDDVGPHPLDGVSLIVAGSAGDGFLRHMAKRGAEVLLTGESDPQVALEKLIAGETLADTRFDPTRALCALRDLFSRH